MQLYILSLALSLSLPLSVHTLFCSSPTGNHSNGSDCSFSTRFVCENGYDIFVETCNCGCLYGQCISCSYPPTTPVDESQLELIALITGLSLLVIFIVIIVLVFATAPRDKREVITSQT